MEKYFLRKFYSFGTTNALWRAIKEFTQGSGTLSEAWERFMSPTRKCLHHGIPS